MLLLQNVGSNADSPRLFARVRHAVIDSERRMTPKFHRRQHQRENVVPVGIDSAAQTTLDFIGKYLDVRYVVRGNDGGRFHVDIILTNTGSRMIPSCCWIIIFYHMK